MCVGVPRWTFYLLHFYFFFFLSYCPFSFLVDSTHVAPWRFFLLLLYWFVSHMSRPTNFTAATPPPPPTDIIVSRRKKLIDHRTTLPTQSRRRQSYITPCWSHCQGWTTRSYRSSFDVPLRQTTTTALEPREPQTIAIIILLRQMHILERQQTRHLLTMKTPSNDFVYNIHHSTHEIVSNRKCSRIIHRTNAMAL